jgi:cytochrome b561
MLGIRPKRTVPQLRTRRGAGTSRVWNGRVERRAHGSAYIRPKHPMLIVALHWGTVAAILASVGAMFLRDAIEDTAGRQVLLQIHRQLGLAVLIVVGVRILVRLTRSLADHSAGMSAVMRLAVRGAHILLYCLLVALPLVGWALTSAHGISFKVLGVVHLPQLVAADSELADTLSDYHIWLSWVLLTLVSVHAAAALWHHFVRRDSVLAAMLPGRAGMMPRRRATD